MDEEKERVTSNPKAARIIKIIARIQIAILIWCVVAVPLEILILTTLPKTSGVFPIVSLFSISVGIPLMLGLFIIQFIIRLYIRFKK